MFNRIYVETKIYNIREFLKEKHVLKNESFLKKHVFYVIYTMHT